MAGRPRIHYWRLLIGRADPTTAAIAVLLALLLVGAVSGTAWWSQRVHTRAAMDDRAREIEDLLDILGGSAQALVEGGQLSALRRQVVETAATHELDRCSVVLPDGRVVADSDVAGINLLDLPQQWEGAAPPASVVSSGTLITASAPFDVVGRGQASLRISARLSRGTAADWNARIGAAGIAAASLVILGFAYRRLDARVRGAAAIGSALRRFRAGDEDFDSLALSERLGPDAEAWNLFVGRLSVQREQLALAGTRDAVSRQRTRGADLAPVCDAMWQGIVVVDDHGRVRYANGAAAVLLGIDRAEFIGAEAARTLPKGDVLDAVTGCLSNRSSPRVTIDLERAGASERCVLRCTVRAMRRDNRPSALIVIEDVTQLRAADEAHGSFVAQATHELRTPLTNIKLYVEEAVDAAPNDAATRARCLNVIGQEARRLERIVGDMLSISEMEAGALQLHEDDVRFDSLFEELRADYAAPAAEKEITLSFDLPPKLPVTIGDRDKIVLALHNLLGNALKYTPAGGEISFRAFEQDATLVVNVADNGIGIDPDECERIFDRFYRAKDPRLNRISGTGLGLTLARDVIRRHGGEITVKSEPDRGSTFTLTLPLRSRAAAA